MDENNMWKVFKDFLDYVDLYPRQIEEFPSYKIDRFGYVYDQYGNRVEPYHYEGQYDSVYLKEKVKGKYGKRDVHVLVAKTFKPEYYKGCVVHHRDENKYNNFSDNLKIESKSEHARHHADPSAIIAYMKELGPKNKGLKAPDETKRKCSIAAKARWKSGVYDDRKNNKCFYGNQYVDKNGNKK